MGKTIPSKVTVNGITFSSHSACARHFDISQGSFSTKIKSGMTAQEAIDITLENKNKRKNLELLKNKIGDTNGMLTITNVFLKDTGELFYLVVM